ncbi:ThuA domain-containing protein [Thalassoroseus pseudoceratinae]|uniref:ThuA domain-containing protein n=1 Tax=Thalassoroseus pseudoceratinae TaxID=2713176 RepID=UPI00141EDB53|nr:ThuA domain-containing protein [Thalassoroseus pseudoceratinae]
MFHRRSLLAVALATVLGLPLSSSAAEKPARVLFLTQSKGFVHGSVKRKGQELSPSEIAMKQLGQQTGLFTLDATQDAATDFTPENLKKYDIVMLYTTGELPISDEAKEYFLNDWLKQPGHGVIGFHSATDTYRNDKPEHAWYRELIGGTFAGHPWNSRNNVTIAVHDPEHPAMQPFGEEFQIQDEIYQYKNFVPENVHVLMSLDMSKCKPSKPYHVPVAWCREWGEGKIFYNNLGHNNQTWTDKRFLKSTENAVKWVLDQVEGDADPNPEVSAQAEADAKKAAS